MGTEQVALLLSGLALGVAAFSVGWNVFRDVVQKPRVKVSYNVGQIPSHPDGRDEWLLLQATNFGPGRVRLDMVYWRRSTLALRLFRETKQGVQLPSEVSPYTGKLPCTLEVGERLQLIFVCDRGVGLLPEEPTHVGLQDTFGRLHWAPKKEVRKALARYRRDFHKVA